MLMINSLTQNLNYSYSIPYGKKLWRITAIRQRFFANFHSSARAVRAETCAGMKIEFGWLDLSIRR